MSRQQSAELRVNKVYCAKYGSDMIRRSWKTHTKNTSTCSYTPPPPSVRNTGHVTNLRKYAIRSPQWRHADINTFRRLQQRLRETFSVTHTAVVNAGRPRTVRTAANEGAIIAAVARQPWRNSRDIWRELRLPQMQLLEELLDDQLAPCHY